MRRRFLYFVPNVSAVNRSVLAAAGLLDVFAACDSGENYALCFTHLIEGPKGSGCLFGIGSRPCEFTAAQTWHDCGAYAIALDDAKLPPGPDDLVREIFLAGESVRLADGNEWIVPRLRLWNAREKTLDSALPLVMRTGLEDGKTRVRFRPRPEHEALDGLADELWECLAGPNEMSLDFGYLACAQLLGANYRLGVNELSLLGLISKEHLIAILEIAIDIAGMREHARELGSAGVCTGVPNED